jgi:serine/threonine-protein kinase RsbW
LETLNTQIDLGKVELVLAEVLNNIAEHGGRESLNHPISLKWYTSDRLCINVINAGRCIPTGTITNAQMPNLDTEIDNLPEGGFGWALVDILCSKVRSKRRGSLNTLRLNFPKNNTAPKNLYFALKFVASLGEYYSYKPHNWLFSVSDFRP